MKPLIVVPTFLRSAGDFELVSTTIATIHQTVEEPDILVVDDGSPARHLVEALALDDRLAVVAKPTNDGFSQAVNIGLARAREQGRDVVLVNADVEFFEAGWLERMAAQVGPDGSRPASVVGALLLYPNGLIQHAGIFFSLLHRGFGHLFNFAPGDLPEAQFARRVPVTAALQFVRHEALVEVGLYDEQFRLGFEDVDYCLRVFMSGRDCVFQPKVRATHHESMFRGRPTKKIERWQQESWVYFMRKHARTQLGEWVPHVVA